MQYELAANIKRRDVLQLLKHLTRWRIALWMADGQLPFMPLQAYRFRWDPAGLPWIDPQKEVAGQVAAIAAQLTSRQRILRRQGEDFDDILDELQEEAQSIGDRGLATALQQLATAPTTPEAPTDDEDDE